jgi:hypothetical protein
MTPLSTSVFAEEVTLMFIAQSWNFYIPNRLQRDTIGTRSPLPVRMSIRFNTLLSVSALNLC